MEYRKHIISEEPKSVVNNETGQVVVIEVGKKYTVHMTNPTTKKDRANNGRLVVVLGFSDGFAGDAIVRYVDNNRRGKLSPCYLMPDQR
ncbi:MAG: hypothetical protein CVV00_11830 [Firmicutes bacterium HGW-Firmicutes-5]|jgi:hypothetical protein|nr:MAG: hypothetical protein CVV00_11830 [Firmicutes bacterium HGW-Firmicutes-5]